jgi:DNA-directed RNA polymerase alpha subunit
MDKPDRKAVANGVPYLASVGWKESHIDILRTWGRGRSYEEAARAGGVWKNTARQVVYRAWYELKRSGKPRPTRKSHIRELGLSTRALNGLLNHLSDYEDGSETVEAAAKLSRKELSEAHNFGAKSLKEVEDALAKVGLKLAP